MNSCPSCALPGPTGRGLCAFCGARLLGGGPTLARLVKTANQYALMANERVLGVAEDESGYWAIRMGGGAEFSLVDFADAGGSDNVLLDQRSNVVTSVTPPLDGRPAMLLDSSDELVGIVRADGCGGLHALTATGDVLVYLGRSNGGPEVIDVLITDAGGERPLIQLFTLMVVLKTQQSHLFQF